MSSKEVKDIVGIDVKLLIDKLPEDHPYFGISQVALAKLCKCNNQTLSNMKTNPSNSIIVALKAAELLDGDIEDMFIYR